MRTDYQKLLAWQRAMELAERIYCVTNRFPSNERFGLTSQMRRAAVSVPSNIAEGQGRFTAGEFRQFLGNAVGSLKELETQIILSARLKYLSDAEADELLQLTGIIGRLITRLVSSDLSNHGAFSRNTRRPL